MNTVILVEGVSDQRALETLATRYGRDLEAEGVSIVPIGGAHAVGPHLERYGRSGFDVKLAGLCDVGEESAFERALERADMGTDLTRDDMERLGFFVCVTDLEDELVRALGSATVLRESSRRRASSGRSARSRSSSRSVTCGLRRAALALHVEPEDPLRAAPRRTRSTSTACRVRSTAS